MAYQIRYGLGGSFGGCENKEWEDCDAKTEDEANTMAWEFACEEYLSYDGLHGLLCVESVMEEEGVDAQEAEDIVREDIESWVEYEAREI